MVPKRQAITLISLIFLAVALFAASRSVWDGVYTKEQAGRGESEYLNHCARCHSENLMGGEESPALVDEDFLAKWNGKTAGELVERIRKTMPTDGPGTLTQKQCTDMTAYLLNANGFPAGEKEMESDPTALNEIRIEPKP
jgi:quinoprotein glucose dehydrogenase